jgi:hypothetical protein
MYIYKCINLMQFDLFIAFNIQIIVFINKTFITKQINTTLTEGVPNLDIL